MIKLETAFTASLFLLFAAAVGLGLAAVGSTMSRAATAAPTTVAARSIPPNCLMDPITHKLVCTPFRSQSRVA